MKKSFVFFSILAATFMLFSSALSAEQGRKHGKPGFVTACEGLETGAACHFTKKDTSCAGTCQAKTGKSGQTKNICVSDTEGCKFEGKRQ